MRTPGSWSELYGRWQALFATDAVEVEEWLREAVRACYGVESLAELPRRTRAVTFQRASGVLLALEEEPGDLAFITDARDVVRAAFARYFDGVALEGPPWRLAPTEAGRPTRAELLSPF